MLTKDQRWNSRSPISPVVASSPVVRSDGRPVIPTPGSVSIPPSARASAPASLGACELLIDTRFIWSFLATSPRNNLCIKITDWIHWFVRAITEFQVSFPIWKLWNEIVIVMNYLFVERRLTSTANSVVVPVHASSSRSLRLHRPRTFSSSSWLSAGTDCAWTPDEEAPP